MGLLLEDAAFMALWAMKQAAAAIIAILVAGGNVKRIEAVAMPIHIAAEKGSCDGLRPCENRRVLPVCNGSRRSGLD